MGSGMEVHRSVAKVPGARCVSEFRNVGFTKAVHTYSVLEIIPAGIPKRCGLARPSVTHPFVVRINMPPLKSLIKVPTSGLRSEGVIPMSGRYPHLTADHPLTTGAQWRHCPKSKAAVSGGAELASTPAAHIFCSLQFYPLPRQLPVQLVSQNRVVTSSGLCQATNTSICFLKLMLL